MWRHTVITAYDMFDKVQVSATVYESDAHREGRHVPVFSISIQLDGKGIEDPEWWLYAVLDGLSQAQESRLNR